MQPETPLNPFDLLKKVRDLTLIERNTSEYLVVACDSVGGIGSKPHDAVQVDEAVLGAFAVRVPLFEIIACGAVPFLVVDSLPVEMNPTGAKIIEAVKAYCRPAGLTEDVQFTGSTEENVPTQQSGIGITVMGLAGKRLFKPGASRSGDAVVCLGVPKSAPEFAVTLDDPEIITLQDLMAVRRLPFAGDMVPVGSRGVAYEAGELAGSASLTFVPEPGCTVDFVRSAGPSTCVLLSVPEDGIEAVKAASAAPVKKIGYLR